MTGWRFIVTFITTLGCGLIAGVFFAFSSFVMRAIGRLPAPQGLAAMQSINVVVINPMFLGVFVGTAVLCVVLAVSSLWSWRAPGTAYMLAGAVLYFAGAFVVTMVCNVPLNDRLAVTDPSGAGAAQFWAMYLTRWTFWNTVRTVAALLAAAALTLALWSARA